MICGMWQGEIHPCYWKWNPSSAACSK